MVLYFIYSGHFVIKALHTSQGGEISVSPEPIKAKDMDTLDTYIKYSFVQGTPPTYAEYFEIDDNTGIIRQVKAIDRKQFRQMQITLKVSLVIHSYPQKSTYYPTQFILIIYS